MDLDEVTKIRERTEVTVRDTIFININIRSAKPHFQLQTNIAMPTKTGSTGNLQKHNTALKSRTWNERAENERLKTKKANFF